MDRLPHDQAIERACAGGDDASEGRAFIGQPDGAEKFVRAEIVAKASRTWLVEEFTKAASERGELPWQLRGSHLTDEPIRRAISNPIYIDQD